MQKINFIPPIVFEILKFKNLAIWLAEGIFAFYLKTRFFQTCCFQNHKVHYGAWFKFRKFTYQWTIFLKPLFLGCFGALSQKYDFFPKIRLFQFFNLKAPKLHEKFQKSPVSCFGENAFTYWHTDILTFDILKS